MLYIFSVVLILFIDIKRGKWSVSGIRSLNVLQAILFSSIKILCIQVLELHVLSDGLVILQKPGQLPCSKCIYIYIYIYGWFSDKSRGQKMNLLKTLPNVLKLILDTPEFFEIF